MSLLAVHLSSLYEINDTLFLQDILKRYRFDLPVGIEHDYANWEKISTYVSFALTQNRSKVKKAVCD